MTGRPARARLGFILRDPALAFAFAAAFIASLVAIWEPSLLPLGGFYEQLATVSLWKHLGDPSWRLDRFYAAQLLPVPGFATVGLERALAVVFPVEIAGRIWLSLYAIALPLGALRLARAFGRDAVLALFSFVLVWNLPLGDGRLSFAAGMAVLAFALAELELLLRSPTRARAGAVVLLALALWLTDAAAWGFFVLAALLRCLSAPRVRDLAALALLLPSLALALVGLHAMPASIALPTVVTPLHRLADVSSSLVLLPKGDDATKLLIAALGVWLILLLSSRTDAADSDARGYRLELYALAALVCALALPADLRRPIDLPQLASRFWPLAALLLSLVPHGPIEGKKRLWVIPILLIAIQFPRLIDRAALTLNKPLLPAQRLAQTIAPGSSTFTSAFSDDDLQFKPLGPRSKLLSQAHAFAVIHAGGFDPDLPIGFPLRRTAFPLSPPNRGAIDLEELARTYDDLLTYGEQHAFERLGPDAQARFPLIATDGNWRLYRRAP